MKSDDSDAITAGWRSVAGSPWFLRSTAYTSGGTTEPDGGTSTDNYQAGSWITITGWKADEGFEFNDAPNQCFTNYLCSRAGLHEFSITQESGSPLDGKHEGVLPSFTYTANADAEVHFLDITNQTLSARLVLGASATPASYVSGLPIVASVERCDWEMPAWTLQGVANFELGAAAFEVRTLGPEEVDEAKYYYPYGDLSNTDQEFAVLDCDDTTLSRAVMFSSTDDRMLRGCRAKIPEVRECEGVETPANQKCQNERLPCATMDHTYVDELPETRNFAVDLSYLGTSDVTAVTTAAPTMTPMPTFSPAPTAVPTSSPTTAAGGTAGPVATVDFEIISPLCLDSVTVSSSGKAADAVTDLIVQKLIDPGVNKAGNPLLRDTAAYPILVDGKEGMLLLSELPAPEEEGLYGKACTANTGAVFREGDAVELVFTLVEREPLCWNADELYPWNDCSRYKNVPLSAHDSLTTDRQVKIRVADGVSGIDDSGEYAGTETFKHIMTAGKPNPFAPFSHELSVEFTRAFDGAEILFVRHVLVVGSIPEEVPQVWTVATNPTLIFSIIRDPPGGESTATLVEGSTISTSMAIDGAHAAQLADNWEFGFSVGGSVKLASTFGILKNIASVHGGAGVVYSETPTDVTVSRSTSRHFDVGISFSVGISTSDSPYIAGQPSDVIIGGGANLRFISAIEIYAKETPNGDPKELCLGGVTALEFLPEKISTWVMSVYEIEKTIERIGAALTDQNTKIEGEKDEHGNIVTDPRADLVKQIENWRTVLANYRAATMKDQAMSVANQLERELDSIHANFQSFLKEATTGGTGTIQFSDFLSHGLNKMQEMKLHYLETGGRSHSNVNSVPGGTAAGKQAEGDVWVYEQSRLKRYENDVLDRVNSVYSDCVGSVEFAEPGGEARLCDVYHNISAKLELKSSLFGICDFKDGHASVKKLRTVLNSTVIFDRPRVTVCIRPNLDSAQVLRERPLSDGGNRRRKHDQRLRRAI